MISQKNSEYLSESSAKVSESRIRGRFWKVEGLLGDDIGNLNYPERVYNVDETAFFLADDGLVVLAERGKCM